MVERRCKSAASQLASLCRTSPQLGRWRTTLLELTATLPLRLGDNVNLAAFENPMVSARSVRIMTLNVIQHDIVDSPAGGNA